jgi:hypothetical protein
LWNNVAYRYAADRVPNFPESRCHRTPPIKEAI